MTTTLPETFASPAMLRVCVIQSFSLASQALCCVLRAHPSIADVHHAESVDPRLLQAFKPDIALLEYNGEETKRRIELIASVAPSTRVCVLADHLKPPGLSAIMQISADGVILKNISLDHFITALHCLAQGGIYADPYAGKNEYFGNHKKAEPYIPLLSHREREVATLIGRGLSNRAVAEILDLSEKTVKNHVSNIFSKLHFTTRTQIAIYAMEQGWSQPPPIAG
jgi:DNA-binding NarL/FixJ family response regulator